MKRRLPALALGLVLALLPSQGWGAAAHVQHNHGQDNDGDSTMSVAYSSNVATGNIAMGFVIWNSGTITLDSVTVCGNAATLVENPTTYAVAVRRIAGFYYPNLSAGACTVTATLSAGVTVFKMVIHEASGLDLTAPLEDSAALSQTDPGTGTDAVTSGSMTPTQDGDYIFGANVPIGGSQTTPGTNFTQGVNSTLYESEYYIQPTAANLAATFTSAASNEDFLTLGMAFKVPAAGAGGTSSMLLGGVGR